MDVDVDVEVDVDVDVLEDVVDELVVLVELGGGGLPVLDDDVEPPASEVTTTNFGA